jgi:hypothetical protein
MITNKKRVSKWTKCDCGKFILTKYTQCFDCYDKKKTKEDNILKDFVQGKKKVNLKQF